MVQGEVVCRALTAEKKEVEGVAEEEVAEKEGEGQGTGANLLKKVNQA